jgi:hypothetical protein
MTETQIEPATHEPPPPAVDDDTARAAVTRLSRSDRSGRTVIERAAILAEGTDSTRIVAWVLAQGGQPEAAVLPTRRGLHGPRLDDPRAANRPPLRYVLPAGVLA